MNILWISLKIKKIDLFSLPLSEGKWKIIIATTIKKAASDIFSLHTNRILCFREQNKLFQAIHQRQTVCQSEATKREKEQKKF